MQVSKFRVQDELFSPRMVVKQRTTSEKFLFLASYYDF